MTSTAGAGGYKGLSDKLGLSQGLVVQELGWDEDVDEDPSVTQLRTEMRDTTLGIGGTTIGVPDAESTKIVLEEDSEMLDDTEPMDTTM